ncbi:MAG: GcvT family protein, partial [Hyphomicrobiaceae bacterium]
GYVDPYQLAMAFGKGARAGGVRIVEGVTVTGFKIAKRRIAAVETDHGAVACGIVVNAAGLWARQVGEMAGLHLPVTVVEHQYLVTEKSDRVPAGLPTLRDPDNNFYLKPEPGALVVGGWEANTIAVNGTGVLPMAFGQELFAGNMDRLAQIAEPAAGRIPILNELGIRTIVNGPIPVSADGEPIMGPSPSYDNFFLACGFTAGIAASGGAGLAMANWIVDGDPGMDLWAFDIRRFGRPHGSAAYVRAAAIESYGKYYAVAWPEEERRACRPLRRSPLHDLLRARGAVHGRKFGYERPNYFLRKGETAPSAATFERAHLSAVAGREHKAIREGVALIDMSSFSKFEVAGRGAFRFLQWLAAADLERGPGAVVYTQLLNARGGIEADVTVMRLAEDTFQIVTGAGFGVRDGHWIVSHMPDDGSVTLRDVSSSTSVVNLCGPRARDVLASVADADTANAAFPYLRCRAIAVGCAPVLAARLSYFGELGYELYIPVEYAVHAYETLLAAGKDYGIVDAGYKAINSLRMEKRYLYWSADITPDDTPLEAGLGFAVSFEKGDFLGRDALLEQREKGLTRRLACFALDEPLAVYGGEAMIADGRAFGVTTSGDFGYTVGKALVLGYVPRQHFDRQTIEVEAFGKRTLAQRIDGCAYDPKHVSV